MTFETTEVDVSHSSITIYDTRHGEIIAEWEWSGDTWRSINGENKDKEEIVSEVQEIVDRTLETECESIDYKKWLSIMVQLETAIEKVMK